MRAICSAPESGSAESPRKGRERRTDRGKRWNTPGSVLKPQPEPEIETAIKDLDWTGKTVRVVSTHEGSGLGNMVSDVKRICKGANVDGKGLAIKGSQAKNSKSAVANWL